jgi:hypothetical protein
MTWKQIRQDRREQHGFEFINRAVVRGTLPAWVTDDVIQLAVFRFHGVLGRLIGLIEGREIQILLIDYRLDAYPHT